MISNRSKIHEGCSQIKRAPWKHFLCLVGLTVWNSFQGSGCFHKTFSYGNLHQFMLSIKGILCKQFHNCSVRN